MMILPVDLKEMSVLKLPVTLVFFLYHVVNESLHHLKGNWFWTLEGQFPKILVCQMVL